MDCPPTLSQHQWVAQHVEPGERGGRAFQCYVWVLALVLFLSNAQPVFALDKRVKLAIKTSAYGFSIGTLVGGATWAMGLGNYRNLLLGASTGLYAGILLAAYIIATPTERYQKHHKPYRHKRPLGPGEEIPEDEWEFRDPGASRAGPQFEQNSLMEGQQIRPTTIRDRAFREVAVWTPVLQVKF